MSERILIIGCPGSGKSTLARRLGQETGLPVVHLDRLFWLPGWVQRPQEDFDQLLLNALQRERWIIEGHFNRSIPLRLEYCDAVLWLDYGRIACLIGVIRRVLGTRGRVRPDMGEGCPERFDWAFLKYVWIFRKTNMAKIEKYLREAPESVRVFRVRSRHAMNNILPELISKS